MPLFRPFAYDHTDYQKFSKLLSKVWPDRDSTVPALTHADNALASTFFFQRMVCELNGEIVAACDYGEPANFYRPGKYTFSIVVDPTHENQGIGSTLYNQMLTALNERALPLTMLATQTREDKPQSVRFLQRRAYEQVMRSPLSTLTVADFAWAKFETLLPKVQASSVELICVADLPMRDANWQRAIYELDWECTLDEPLPDAPTKLTYEEYVAEVFDNPTFLPAAWFVALDQGRYVGMTATNRNAQHPRQLDTIFTAIVRSHRRRGLATALKLLVIDYAQRNGYTTIKADNEEHNPMYQINLSLGFQPAPALLFFQKLFGDA